MTIKLIALDMDGTTLTSDIALTDTTRLAIEGAIQRGCVVVPCTGRVFSEIPQEVLDIPGISYTITSNGAQVRNYREDDILYANTFTKEELKAVMAILADFDVMAEANISGCITVEGKYLSQLADYNVKEAYWDFIRDTRVTFPNKEIYKDFVQNSPVEKFNVFFRDLADRERLQGVLTQKTQVGTILSSENNLEINNPTASKGDGLRHLCEILGIAAQEVMAIGDSNNDMAMLSYAGLPVAMGNGTEKAKAMAHYVTKTNDEDGVANALNHFILHA